MTRVTNLIKSFLCIPVFMIIPGLGHAQLDPAILLNDLKVLSHDSMEGRKTGSSGNEKAREFILNRLGEIGIETPVENFEQQFHFNTRNGELNGINLIASVRGSQFSENFMVISAHYDHVGIRSGEIHNGADDNASGTAALISIAKYFSLNQPRHSLIFAFFDAEESGLQGAKAFVAANKKNIILNINLDMISRNDSNEIYVAGTHQNPHLKDLVKIAIPEQGKVEVLFGHDTPGSGGHDWSDSSDHGPFNKAGIPFLYFGVEDHEDYHKPEDDFEKIDQEFYISVVNMLIRVISHLDKALE